VSRTPPVGENVPSGLQEMNTLLQEPATLTRRTSAVSAGRKLSWLIPVTSLDLSVGGCTMVCNVTRPADNYEATGYYCNKEENCRCWRVGGCYQDASCANIGGECNKESPWPGARPTGYLCNQDEGCHCWLYDCKAHEDPTCKEKYNGVCGKEQPGPTFEMTGHWCNRTEQCHCWAERSCPEDPTCAEKFGGVCNVTWPGPGFKREHTDYVCRTDTGKPGVVGGKDCFCWEKEEEVDCRKKVDKKCKKMKGVCDSQRPKPGYVPTDYYCKKDERCNCWIECEDKKCEQYGGQCSVRQPVGYIRTKHYCDKKTKCHCWTKPCEPGSKSKLCDGGLCYPPGSDVPPNFVRDGWCDKLQTCECWKEMSEPSCEPGSVSKTCDEGRGFCYPPGSIVPANLERDGLCDELKTCECWKKIWDGSCEPGSESRNCKGGKCWPYGVSPGQNWQMNGWCDRDQKCQCWVENKCSQSSKCLKKGGVCQAKPFTSAETISGKNLCKKPCKCVRQITEIPATLT